MTNSTSPGRLRLGLISIQVLFGLNYLASKIVVTEIGPRAWAAWRTVLAFVIIAGIACLRRSRWPNRRDIGLLGIAALFGVVLNQALFLEGLSRTQVSRSALICSQIPTFVLIFSIAAGQERLTRRKCLSFISGLFGVLVLLRVDHFSLDANYITGDLLTLANAASYGLYIVISRRLMTRHDPLAATAVVFGWGALGMAIYGGSAAINTDFSALTTVHYSAIAYVIIGATVVTYFLNLWAIKHATATRVALFIFLQPLVATTLGVVFRDEVITVRFCLAGALILAALLWSQNE